MNGMDAAMVESARGMFDWGAKLVMNGVLVVCSNNDDVERLQTYIQANREQFDEDTIAIAAKKTTVECVDAMVEALVTETERERRTTTAKLAELVLGAPWVATFFGTDAGEELYERLCAMQVTHREETVAEMINGLRTITKDDAAVDLVWLLMEGVVTQVKAGMDMALQLNTTCHRGAAFA
jgi:hypothetical protein